MQQEEFDAVTPPQDTGAPDSVEEDPAALGSAEDLDEDRLQQDPLEGGVDPPEQWSGVDRWGTTPAEEREGEPLEERLAEEQPDTPVPPSPEREPDLPRGLDDERSEEADKAGGSVADAIRTPRPPE
ncbi:hypothetical protein LY13_002913 [Prauserella aidingensis]|uniref:hypothetical protein n=1 Tax=Prauserella aidingensis TaxID=387890 RepID=UPI0020A425B9|nr:hypothetical protein [Prauserella aidingensis]MCP2254148.1 hypothetical protein [Prauserella aidingensis]